MPDSTQCPYAETLALLPDGRASGRLRLSLMVHLDGCTPCRRVVAYTGKCEASREAPPPEGHSAEPPSRIELKALESALRRLILLF